MYEYTSGLVCLLVLCATALEWIHGRRMKKFLSRLPSFTRLPFLGNILHLVGGPQNVLIEITEVCERSCLPFAFWFGSVPVIVLSEPEDIKTATKSLLEKAYCYNFFRPYLGDGLFTASGCTWKKLIKKFAVCFTGNTIDRFQSVFNEQAHTLAKNLQKKSGQEPFDVHTYCASAALAAICETSLGQSETLEKFSAPKYYHAMIRALDLIKSRGLNIFYHPDFIYRWSSSYSDLQKCATDIQEVSETILKEASERNKTRIQPSLGTKTENGVSFKTVIDMYLEEHKVDPMWTWSYTRSEIDALIFAGQDTVATALGFILLMIGNKPRVQKKLYDEIFNIFSKDERDVELEDLKQMEYCEAVILETLRLFPPAPVIMRYADCDLTLGSCTIPAGATVVVNIWGAGRSRRQWGDDALEFCPERWLDSSRQSAPFFPFSYGKRNCIGKRYALAFLKTALAQCVRKLEFTSDVQDLKLKLNIFLKPESGYLIQVRTRD